VRSKIEIERSILEQVKKFNYLGCELSLDGEPDFDKKNKEVSRKIRKQSNFSYVYLVMIHFCLSPDFHY